MVRPLQATRLSPNAEGFLWISETVCADWSSRRFLAVSIMLLLFDISSAASRAGDVWVLEVCGLFKASICLCSVHPCLSAVVQWFRFLRRGSRKGLENWRNRRSQCERGCQSLAKHTSPHMHTRASTSSSGALNRVFLSFLGDVLLVGPGQGTLCFPLQALPYSGG